MEWEVLAISKFRPKNLMIINYWGKNYRVAECCLVACTLAFPSLITPGRRRKLSIAWGFVMVRNWVHDSSMFWNTCTWWEVLVFLFVWFDSLCPINNLSVKQGRVFLGWTSTKLGKMCLAQGLQHSDAGEARTRGPSVSSQALYHWATALPSSGV